jgi:hypothetical protein
MAGRIGSDMILSGSRCNEIAMGTETDMDAPALCRRRFGKRKVTLLAAAVLVAGAAWAVFDHHHACACQLPPIPNMTAFHYAARMAADHNYERAREAFDMLVDDPRSGTMRPLALYGRGVSRRALGDAAGGEADIAAALELQPGAGALYASFAPPQP